MGKDQATKNTEGYEVPEFDHSYVDNYIHKVHDYVDAGDHYKTDNLQVKVNWNLQDGKHEYLKSQYGIYPQLQPKYGYGGYGKPHYGGGYGGYSKGGYAGGYGGGYGHGGGYGYGGKSHYGGGSGYGGGFYGGHHKSGYGGGSGYGGNDGSKDAQYNQDGHQYTDENQE